MPVRLKKLIGLVIIISFMCFYALLVMTIAVAKLQDAPHWQQAVFFLVTGVAWGIPLLPVIKWMEKDPNASQET